MNFQLVLIILYCKVMKRLKNNIGTILLAVMLILHIVFIHIKISNVESKIPTDYVPRIEYDLKDQMIRESIRNIHGDIRELQRELEKIEEVRYVMAQKIDEGTQITLDLKTIGIILFFVATVVGMWFSLNASIDEAKELPIPPDPEVTRMEFDMKDQMIRNTILNTQGDVTEIKEDIKRIEEKIDGLR